MIVSIMPVLKKKNLGQAQAEASEFPAGGHFRAVRLRGNDLKMP
jgi:hypothetical protein